MVRSCSAMGSTLAELRADIRRFTLEAQRLRYEASELRGWAEEGKPLSGDTRKRLRESGDVKEGDYATFSRQADIFKEEAEACEAFVRELRAIEKEMVERRRAEHPPDEMRE